MPVSTPSPGAVRLTPPATSDPSHTTSVLVQRTRRRSLISFEVFPPRPATAGRDPWRSIELMAEAAPDYFSVTHGHNQPEGANVEVIRHLLRTTPSPVMAHLICAGSTSSQLRGSITELLDLGVRDILALRGDPPDGGKEWIHQPGGLNRAAEVVELVREVEQERLSPPEGPGARPVSVSVAAYPPSGTDRDHAADLHALWEKQEAGADYAVTQVFYDPEDYAQLVDSARSQGIHLPIVAGIAPLTSPRRLRRLEEITGVPVPRHLVDYLDVDDAAERRRRGVAATLNLIDTVLELGCPGLHLFTFNQHPPALAILDHLRIRDAARRQRNIFDAG
ncbi:methylenetetrahydrofolate reductase [Nesterenkonia xinjiangensis]|uniref:Methylenetetrahydrofolate reductase n=1 Tax=Nesterenkonia xinjiangensis TaxID=225327 RepID=A0A7Z0GMN0_9MICC|nr:methylenetetrahydrofolate reductase [Nesterenkonia xinjiangensis]NYJ78715.1 methylenetetrahydrofolate reductase (NADPH) [Nesterenkonia xinjiangensis]